MGVFHIEYKKCIITPFICTPILSIILPIFDVFAEAFRNSNKNDSTDTLTQETQQYSYIEIVHWSMNYEKEIYEIYHFLQAFFTLSRHDKYNEKKLC